MSDPHSIPEVGFRNIQQRAFEFAIITNKDLLDSSPSKKPLINHNLFRPHRLQFYAILVILKGEGHHHIDFKNYKYKKGSVIFISKEQVHAFEPNMERKAYFLLFTEKFLEKSSLGSNLMQQLSLYNYHLYPPVLHLKKKELIIFSELVKRIKTEFDAPDDALTEEIILSSLKIFLCLAERLRNKKQKFNPRQKYQQEYAQFQKLLKLHILQSRQVQFYADAMNISTKKLNRITREILNQPAKNYINDFLIIEMKRFLINTSLSIKEIAYKTGFDEATNFVKYFKKYTNTLPSDFRKKY